MATILAHIQIKPGAEAAFENTARAMHEASHGRETALRRYEYWRGQKQGYYYCLLAFDDFRGFMAHQTSPHHEAAAAPLMESIADLKLEWLDPVPGASDLASSQPQAIADDANELTKRYAEIFPVALAEWWAPLRTI